MVSPVSLTIRKKSEAQGALLNPYFQGENVKFIMGQFSSDRHLAVTSLKQRFFTVTNLNNVVYNI